MNQDNNMKCTHCSSTNLHVGKKGFSGINAIAGFIFCFAIVAFLSTLFEGILFGLLGIFAGTIGSNKIRVTCLSCGNSYIPGSKSNPVVSKAITWILVAICAFLIAAIVFELLKKNGTL